MVARQHGSQAEGSGVAMAMDLMLVKHPKGYFVPATSADMASTESLKVGKEFGITLTQLRNGRFHRKLFSLLEFAYDNSERVTVEHKGKVIGQSFDSFRDALVIQAGYHHIDVTIKGDVRYTAQSLSYAKCSQELAERIYNDVLQVICKIVFSDGRYTPDELAAISEEMINYY